MSDSASTIVIHYSYHQSLKRFPMSRNNIPLSMVMSVRCSLTSFSRHRPYTSAADGDVHHRCLPAWPPETPCWNSHGSVRGGSSQPLSSMQDGSSASDLHFVLSKMNGLHCNAVIRIKYLWSNIYPCDICIFNCRKRAGNLTSPCRQALCIGSFTWLYQFG